MRALWVILLLLSTLMMSGCELIGNIFQAGMWVGVILVLLVVLFFTLKRTQWLLFPVGVLGILLSKRLLAWSMVVIPCLMVFFIAIDVASLNIQPAARK